MVGAATAPNARRQSCGRSFRCGPLPSTLSTTAPRPQPGQCLPRSAADACRPSGSCRRTVPFLPTIQITDRSGGEIISEHSRVLVDDSREVDVNAPPTSGIRRQTLLASIRAGAAPGASPCARNRRARIHSMESRFRSSLPGAEAAACAELRAHSLRLAYDAGGAAADAGADAAAPAGGAARNYAAAAAQALPLARREPSAELHASPSRRSDRSAAPRSQDVVSQ